MSNWTDRQTDRLKPPGAGSANSGAYYIPVLSPNAASRPAASPTLCPRNNGRGLVIKKEVNFEIYIADRKATTYM